MHQKNSLDTTKTLIFITIYQDKRFVKLIMKILINKNIKQKQPYSGWIKDE